MYVVGIDLSGPSNTKNTAYACFERRDEGLTLGQYGSGATDDDILHLVASLAEQAAVVVGIDAPLSYNPGGGDRPADKKLRKRVISAGLHPGSVMTPTMAKMAYLTLRGICVARLLQSIAPQPPAIVEVHPGATMALRGAPLEQVKTFKHSATARQGLLDWLRRQGVRGLAAVEGATDHLVAACAGALAAWKWHTKATVWLEPAAPPFHPFDYAA